MYRATLQKLHQLRPFPSTLRKMLHYHWYIVDSMYYYSYSTCQTTAPTQPLPPPTWLSPNRTQPQGRSAANRRVLCASQTSGSARGLGAPYWRASHCYRDVSIQRHHLVACATGSTHNAVPLRSLHRTLRDARNAVVPLQTIHPIPRLRLR